MTSHQKVAVRVENVFKSYSGTPVLDDVSIEIHSGDFYVLMGPNGSGKSTLLSIIAGTNPFDSGTVTILGADIQRDPVQARNHIGYVPQKNFCSEFLTGRENLQYFGGLLGLSKRERYERISRLLRITGLEGDADRRVAEYSGGMQKKLEVATALLKNVQILLLDETLTGLDPTSRREFLTLLNDIRAMGTAILMVTHIGEDAEVASRVGFMINGRIVADGTPKALKEASGLKSLVVVDAVPRTKDLLKVLNEIGQVERVSNQDGTVSVVCDDPAETVPTIADTLHSSGFDILRIVTKTPTLEDVFYRLTNYSMEVA